METIALKIKAIDKIQYTLTLESVSKEIYKITRRRMRKTLNPLK